MTNYQEMSNVAKETIELLKYFDKSFVSKISPDFLKQLEELSKDSNITVTIDKNLDLKSQKVSSETKDLICILYYQYVAKDKEKRAIVNLWEDNDILYKEKSKKNL